MTDIHSLLQVENLFQVSLDNEMVCRMLNSNLVLISISMLIIIGLWSSSFPFVIDNENKGFIAVAQQSVPLSVTLEHAATCQDLTATRKGISVSFIIKGLYHLDNTYRSEITGPDGNIIIDELNGLPVSDDLSRLIPRDASNPATLFLGKSFATQKFGTFTFIVFGSDGSKSSLSFAVPQCPTPLDAQQIQQLIDNIENDDQLSERAKSHLVNRLEKALSALTDETSANNKKITCKFLNSSLSSLEALEKSNQITSTQAAKIGEQLLPIISNLNC